MFQFNHEEMSNSGLPAKSNVDPFKYLVSNYYNNLVSNINLQK